MVVTSAAAFLLLQVVFVRFATGLVTPDVRMNARRRVRSYTTNFYAVGPKCVLAGFNAILSLLFARVLGSSTTLQHLYHRCFLQPALVSSCSSLNEFASFKFMNYK